MRYKNEYLLHSPSFQRLLLGAKQLNNNHSTRTHSLHLPRVGRKVTNPKSSLEESSERRKSLSSQIPTQLARYIRSILKDSHEVFQFIQLTAADVATAVFDELILQLHRASKIYQHVTLQRVINTRQVERLQELAQVIF